MERPSSLQFLVLAVIGILPLTFGCGRSGPARYPVTGVVSWQGKPLETGAVMFVPEDGPAVTSTIDTNGRYRLNAAAGDHGVAVAALPEPPPDADVMTYMAQPLIPPRFGRAETSGLRVTVQPKRRNHIDIALD